MLQSIWNRFEHQLRNGRQVNWNRLRGVRESGRDCTKRVPSNPNDKPLGFHLIYDPYLPPNKVKVHLHCTECKQPKEVILDLPPGAKEPQPILAYRCAYCAPKHAKRSLTLRQRFPGAYSSWKAMRGRCLVQSHIAYRDYGGRGITICPRWLNKRGFENFLEDMGERPPGMSIDRKHVNGNYTPQNCRWATVEEQANNKRNSKMTPEEWEAALAQELQPY